MNKKIQTQTSFINYKSPFLYIPINLNIKKLTKSQKYLMKKLYQILPVILFFLIGCSTDIDTLQRRGYKLYEINSETPFSGPVVGRFKKD